MIQAKAQISHVSKPPFMQDFQAVHAQTIGVYEAEAEAWDRSRPRSLTEKLWLDKFATVMPAGGTVLDAGCGGGDPIARYLIDQGFSLTGIDAAQSMIAIAQARFPMFTWQQMDMRTLNLECKFDGILSWDSFFHLTPDEQRLTLRFFSTICSRMERYC